MVGLWGEVLEDVWQLVCSIKNKVSVPYCLWLTFLYCIVFGLFCSVVSFINFVLLTCPLFGTRNYCDLEKVM